MVTEEEKNAAHAMGLEPEVVFNTLSDRIRFAVHDEETHECIFEITGYDLQVRFNRDKLKDIGSIESVLDGIKDLFRRMILEDLVEQTNG